MANVHRCPEGIIQHELYRVLQPLWVVAQKKVFNPGYTGCYGLCRVRTFSLEPGIVRGVSGGEISRKVSGGWGRGCSEGNFVPRWDCTVCVCVWGGGGPDKVYGVIYGLDIVALKFTRPLCSSFLFTNFNT